jgi:hypothetical protein
MADISRVLSGMLNRRTRRVLKLGKDLHRCRIALDLSGSTAHYHPRIKALWAQLISKVAASPAMAAQFLIGATVMSEKVLSSPYQEPGKAELPEIKAGGTSPIAQMVRDLTAADADKCAMDGVTIAILLTDGQYMESDEEMRAAIAAYRAAQDERNIHVFPVALGMKKMVNWNVLNALSVKHTPAHSPDLDFDAIFEAAFGLIESASISVQRMASVKTIDINRKPE